jgi:DNA-binding MarR family transcriptional regulator
MTREEVSPVTLPIVDPAVELAELFSRVARRLRRAAKQELSPLALTWAQARVLRLVYESPDPLRMADIACRLEIVARSATTMVDALANAELVTRAGDPGDRRSVLVAVTPAGRTLVEHLDEARRCAAYELFGRLDEAEQERLLHLLQTLLGTSGTPGTPGDNAQGV